jgi:hypothetical protein
MTKKILCLIGISFLFSCGEEPTEPSSQKDCIETSIDVKKLPNSMEVIETTHIVYNSKEKKTIVHYDTIPSLDQVSETADDGSAVLIDKDYDLFITVK